jgi:uncharacterized membrane protein
MKSPHGDQITDEYLARLIKQLAPLPATRRTELLDEVRAHIAEARSRLVDETEADVLNILDRLGDPAETAAAEMGRPEPPTPALRSVRVLEILAIVFLLVFWPVGVALLWISDAWTSRDKLIGTLVPPGGYLALFVLGPMLAFQTFRSSCETLYGASGRLLSSTCPSSGQQAMNIGFGLLGVLFLIAPIITAAYLGIRLRPRETARTLDAAIAARR